MIQLLIAKGIPKLPDTNSAEAGVTTLNLLDAGGFSVVDGGWVPKYASLKDDGLYADTPLADGRTLVAAASDNVTETIKLTATAATFEARYWLQSRLANLAQDARRFHTNSAQIEPVYLVWWASGAPGAQYALIYNIEFAQSEEAFVGFNVNELTITVEREPFWRGLPPGANPKLWALEQAATAPTVGNAALHSGSDHLLTATFKNWAEWANTGQTARLTQNWFAVPAASIPGDAPALVEMVITASGSPSSPPYDAALLARWTKPMTLTKQDGSSILNTLTFNAADATLRTGSAVQADTGAVRDGSGTYRRVAHTFAGSGTTYPLLIFQQESNFLRGACLVFARVRTSAASTPVDLTLNINGSVVTSPARLNDAGGGGTGNTTTWAIVYLGTVDFGKIKQQDVGIDGRGLYVTNTGLDIVLNANRISGTGLLYVNDLIFIPISEQAQFWNADFQHHVFYDNTGYLQHGAADDNLTLITVSNEKIALNVGTQGQPFTLVPGVDNHFFFLLYASSTNQVSMAAQGDFTYTVRLNAVPRWTGARDV